MSPTAAAASAFPFDTNMTARLRVVGAASAAVDEIWTEGARAFVAAIAARFTDRRDQLLAARLRRQAEFDAGAMPDFLPKTAAIRNGDWKVAPIPADLQDRRVEITGPVDRKMVINALNSGAKTFMADFEDSAAPTWELMVQGQINLRDAIRGTISYDAPDGRRYALDAHPAVLIVRPRGWHLPEKHVLFDGQPLVAAFMDFGLYFYHNVAALRAKGSAPYFYLPKMESHLEARLWNDIFVFAQAALDVPQGTIRATALIETLPAAFEMDEFLYELRDHAAGLNCGRWDYIFNFIKCFRNHPDFVLPDRGQVTMTSGFLRAYSQLLIKTCHRRGIHAMGGMAAQIPNKNDPVANQAAFDKVRADKLREVKDGHDGTWIAHPALIPVALEVFNEYMPQSNQIALQRDDVRVTAADLVALPQGTITEAGLRNNVHVSLRYIEAWLRGNGCVPLYGLMEDAATAEIARTQLWQWAHYPKGVLDDGRKITVDMVDALLKEDIAGLQQELGAAYATTRYDAAAALLTQFIADKTLSAFLTTTAYNLID